VSLAPRRNNFQRLSVSNIKAVTPGACRAYPEVARPTVPEPGCDRRSDVRLIAKPG